MNPFLEALARVKPGPDWIATRATRIDRLPSVGTGEFEPDRPRTIAAAWGHMGHLIDTGQVPEEGDRDEHVHAFLAKMHGLGCTGETAYALYDAFLQVSGGAAPSDWPNDAKVWAKVKRIWENESGTYSELGSELAALSIEEKIERLDAGAPDEDRLPRDRLWYMEDLANQRPITYWDAEHLLPRVPSGAVGIMFGRYSHHKTNLALSKIRELLVTTEANVLYLMGEGTGGMGKRLRAQLDFAERTMVEFRGRFRAFEVPEVTIQDQVDEIERLCAEAEFRPDIIILDTLANAITGLDEDNRTASLLGRKGPVGKLAKLYKALVLMIGHEGDKPGKLRGGSGFYGNVDFVIYVRANAHNFAVALTAQTSALDGAQGGGGKPFKEAEPIKLYYAIEYHRGVPIPVPTSSHGYELLTGDAKWEGAQAAGNIFAALQRLGAPATTYTVVMDMHPRAEGMGVEDWQDRCANLARKMDKAARADAQLGHLFKEVEGSLVWQAAPAAA